MRNGEKQRVKGGWVSAFIAGMAFPAYGQDINFSSLMYLGQSVTVRGASVLDNADDKKNEMLGASECVEAFASEEVRRGALQVGLNMGASAAKSLFLSIAQTCNVERGAIGRFRIPLNGENVYLVACCDGATMSGESLSWGEGSSEPAAIFVSSFDAAALFWFLHTQGSSDIKVRNVRDPYAPPAASGPEAGLNMSDGERTALRLSVQRCLNPGSLTPGALRTTIVVGFEMTPDRRPVVDSMRMIESFGGDENAARQAFETARRAIIRCGVDGLTVPVRKYNSWKYIRMTFNFENMLTSNDD